MRRSVILILLIPALFLFLTNGLFSTTRTDSLYIDPDTISVSRGGTVTFYLDAGIENAYRKYLIFGGVSGTKPGFYLPGGAVLPINWDWITYTIYLLAFTPGNGVVENLYGELDKDGKAEAYLVIPPNSGLPPGGGMNFAYALANPWDFASNPVMLYFVP